MEPLMYIRHIVCGNDRHDNFGKRKHTLLNEV